MVLNFISVIFHQPHTSVLLVYLRGGKAKEIYLRRTDVIQKLGAVTKSLDPYIGIFTLSNSVPSAHPVYICLMKDMPAYSYADTGFRLQ